MSEFSYIGKRIPKPDALPKATGEIVYGHDLKVPRMLHGKILRSPVPHARILHIDISHAKRLPGVRAVITAKDLPDRRFGFGNDRTPLKGDKVRRFADEIAAVAAVDEDTALEALELIQVDYEPLPTIFDPEDALKPDAPLIHEDRENNLFRHQVYMHGNPDWALDEADVIVEDFLEVGYVQPAPLETSFCLADFDATGHLTVWSTTQIPFLLQRDLSGALGIPGSDIRIIQTAIGGAFGRGLDMYAFEPICVWLSRVAGQPVRLAFTRQEEFIASEARQPIKMWARAGAMRDGRLWVRDARLLLDNGAYVSWGTVTTLVLIEAVGSLYRVPHVRVISNSVYTNNPITGAMRGFGNPQGTFLVEVQMDRLAEAIGMDPLEFRLKNANQPFEETPQRIKITSCGLTECLEEAGTRIGWERGKGKRAKGKKEKATEETGRAEVVQGSPVKRRGIGIAATLNVGGGARIYRSDGCGCIVKVDDFGRVTLMTGATEIGQGSDVALSQIVAEELGIAPGEITVINNDTALTPWDVGVHASRTTFIAGNAALLAARAVKAQILETAEELLEASPADLQLRDGHVEVRGASERRVPFDKVVRARHFREGGQVIIGHGWYDPPNEMVGEDGKGNISAAYGFGAQAIEVEVDTETGRVRPLRVVSAHDVGRAINPMYVEGQIEGGVVMGLGYALSEELQVHEGRVVNLTPFDYRMPTIMDAPPIECVIVETDDPEGPFGAKGVGEMGTNPTAAAVANAVYDAIGVRINSLPITPEKVLRALCQQAIQPSSSPEEQS
ncbi:MAG: xanthine dehydrogenase family protein molybdopterin-binding subunit [Anaerolineae bacterium]